MENKKSLEQLKRPIGAKQSDSKLRSNTIRKSVDLQNKIVINKQARMATLDRRIFPSKLRQDPYQTVVGLRGSPHSRISTERMISHLQLNSMAQEQMNKIKGLLQKARGRHEIMETFTGEVDISKVAQVATDEQTFAKGFELRKSLDLNFSTQKPQKLQTKKNLKSSSIENLTHALQSYDSQRNQAGEFALIFGNSVPTVRSSYHGQAVEDHLSNRYTNRVEKMSQFSISGIPQKGTDRTSHLGMTTKRPLLKDILLKDEPRVGIPQKLKPIHDHLKLSIKERKTLAKQRLQQSQSSLPKFTEMTKKSVSHKKNLSRQQNNTSNIQIFPSNGYDEESQVILGDEYNNQLNANASKSLLLTNESPSFSKNPSTSLLMNPQMQLNYTQSSKAIERIISLQSIVDQEINEQQGYIKRRQNSMESLKSNQKSNMRYNRSNFLSYNNSATSLDSIPSASKLSPQAIKEIQRSLAVTKSQDKITFRDFSLPPEHGKKQLAAPFEDKSSDLVTNKVNKILETMKRTKLGDEINEKLRKDKKQKDINVWELPKGQRNKLLSESYFTVVEQKKHNMRKPTDATSSGKNPLLIGSFEGIALKQSKLRLKK